MSWYLDRPYISAATKKAKAQKKLKALLAEGHALEPIDHLTNKRLIAASFWGRSWCRHLESYSDYDNRLPRGRTYVRNGSVLHLGIEPGKVRAMVQGSELYELTLRIKPLPADKWKVLQQSCRGKIGSLIELLQGKISDEIMGIVTDPTNGLFPDIKEIQFDCNCPDWANMCKHVAAVLYGIGARLDTAPELLFKLRGVDHRELLTLDATAEALNTKAPSGRRRTLSASAMSDVFGLDIEPAAEGTDTAKTKVPPEPESSKPAHTTTKAARTPEPPLFVPVEFEPTSATVRIMRKQLGLSRAAFARKLGVSEPSIYNWERKVGRLRFQTRTLTKLRQLHATLKRKGR